MLAKKGQSQWGQDYDDIVVVPYTTFQQKIQGGLKNFIEGSVAVSATSADTTGRAESQIRALLRDRHRLPLGADDDFSIRNLSEMASAQQEGTRTLTTLLAAIAAVSLLVGGIGIMNIMLVSVTERTREIGLRMAVGAKPADIRLQFLVEALALAVTGGLIGVALGVFGAWRLATSFGWEVLYRPDVIAIAVGFSGARGGRLRPLPGAQGLPPRPHHRPEVRMNALLLALAVAAAPAAAPAAPPPLSLESALDIARANPQLAQAQASSCRPRGRSGSPAPASSPSAPSPGARAGRRPTSAPRPPATLYATYGASVSLNQTLWDFGRTLGSYLAARDQERAARAGVDATWTAVELNVRTAYYTVLATEALVAVADQTVASNQRQLDLARGQFEVGQRPRFDVTSADVNLQQSRISQIQAHDGVVLARIALSQSIGQDVSGRSLVMPQVPQRHRPRRAEAPRARPWRPDPTSAVAEFLISAADSNLSAAKSAWFPILGVSATYKWNDSKYPVAGGLPAPDANSWNLLGTLTWPFLNGGADLGRVDTQSGVVASAEGAPRPPAAPDPHRRRAGRGQRQGGPRPRARWPEVSSPRPRRTSTSPRGATRPAWGRSST